MYIVLEDRPTSPPVSSRIPSTHFRLLATPEVQYHFNLRSHRLWLADRDLRRLDPILGDIRTVFLSVPSAIQSYIHLLLSRQMLSLPFLSALVTILAAIIGTELWLHDYGLANVGLHLPTRKPPESNSKQDLYDDDLLCPVNDGEPTLKCGTHCYKSDLFR